MRKRFYLQHDEIRGFYVDLPTYKVVNGTHDPIVKGKVHKDGVDPSMSVADALRLKPSVLVDLPDSIELDTKGEIDATKLRRRYPSHCQHGDKTYKPPKVLGER